MHEDVHMHIISWHFGLFQMFSHSPYNDQGMEERMSVCPVQVLKSDYLSQVRDCSA